MCKLVNNCQTSLIKSRLNYFWCFEVINLYANAVTVAFLFLFYILFDCERICLFSWTWNFSLMPFTDRTELLIVLFLNQVLITFFGSRGLIDWLNKNICNVNRDVLKLASNYARNYVGIISGNFHAYAFIETTKNLYFPLIANAIIMNY